MTSWLLVSALIVGTLIATSILAEWLCSRSMARIHERPSLWGEAPRERDPFETPGSDRDGNIKGR